GLSGATLAPRIKHYLKSIRFEMHSFPPCERASHGWAVTMLNDFVNRRSSGPNEANRHLSLILFKANGTFNFRMAPSMTADRHGTYSFGHSVRHLPSLAPNQTTSWRLNSIRRRGA